MSNKFPEGASAAPETLVRTPEENHLLFWPQQTMSVSQDFTAAHRIQASNTGSLSLPEPGTELLSVTDSQVLVHL
jgi:hypothetical protein